MAEADAARAAELCTADLMTEVVGEFPEVQGLMGRRYAELLGENADVSAAIEEHYKPQGPSDFVPSNKSDSNNRMLTNLSTDLLCIKENCYTDITKTEGFNPTDCRIFSNNAGKFLIVVYYSRNLNTVCDTLKTHVKTMITTQKIKLYGFSPETETLVSDFLDVSDLVDAVPLPEAIYNAYRATFRTLKFDKKRVAIVTPTDEAAGETTLFDEAETLED